MVMPVLTPHGVLALRGDEEAPAPEPAHRARLEQAFLRGSGHGLLALGADEVGTALPAEWSYWRDFGARYVTALCALPELGEGAAKPAVPAPGESELAATAAAVPPMTGAEYLTAATLAGLWRAMDEAFDAELADAGLSVQEFLKSRHPAWNLVGRVHFNLAENRKDEEAPFAFLATYTTRLSASAKAQHMPLGRALQEYAGANNRERLLSLLTPVQRAAERCGWLKAMVDAGEIFHPLRWAPQQALQFLRDAPALESAGVVVRMPASWRMNRPARPQVKATVGGKPPSRLGVEGLLDFAMEVTLDGERLSAAEIKQLLAHSEGLAMIRGRWVEVDHARLSRTLEQFETIERRASADGLSFGEAMRMLAGAGITGNEAAASADVAWSETVAGPWLAETLAALRGPDGRLGVGPGRLLHGTLRPYQLAGMQWLYLLARLGLGACLADDMGLGKTIQVLSLLLVLGNEAKDKPSLLVAPASLLANWAAEIARFAPSLKAVVAHPSAMSGRSSAEGWRACAGGRRPRHHQLRLPRARAMALRDAVAAGGARRGAGDQESRRQADPDRQAARGRHPHRPHRHADREPARRPVVDLRLHQSGIAGFVKTVLFVRQRPRRAAAQSLRPAPRPGATLYPAAAEDRQEHHRRTCPTRRR